MSASETPPRSRRSTNPSGPRTVLVVDDDEATRALTARWLKNAKLNVLEASSGEAGLELAIAGASTIDTIVLDVMMPGLDGFATLKRLKEMPATAVIPVVLLTAHANHERDVVEGVETGAVDHIAKPFSGPVLVAKVRQLCERSRGERELRAKLRQAEQTATVDALTSLGNRRHFEARLREESAHARRHQQPFALVMLDIDHFKTVNDTFGHEEGDRVLVHFADVIRSILRADDAAFRYGGEEFVLILRACDAERGVRAAERLRAALKSRPIELGEASVVRHVTFSAGVASPRASSGFATDDLVSRADAALYVAKRGGRDRVEVSAS